MCAYTDLRAAARDLHIKLHCVHTKYSVANMTQHVGVGRHSHERRQLQQLLQLRLPSEDKYPQSFTHTSASHNGTHKKKNTESVQHYLMDDCQLMYQ